MINANGKADVYQSLGSLEFDREIEAVIGIEGRGFATHLAQELDVFEVHNKVRLSIGGGGGWGFANRRVGRSEVCHLCFPKLDRISILRHHVPWDADRPDSSAINPGRLIAPCLH